jgi:Protein of unknown function (DUF3277)
MSVSLRIYDADQVTAILVGVMVETGLNDGEFLKIEVADDAFKSKVGTDGEVTMSKTNNFLLKITCTLMQSSSTNALFSAIHELDRKTPGGLGVAPFMIRDRQGTSLYSGRFSRIMKAPDATFDREAGPREWTFAAISDERLDGGN